MAKTASERQAAYRAKPDQYRLSLYINGEARAALTALARHRGCSEFILMWILLKELHRERCACIGTQMTLI